MTRSQSRLLALGIAALGLAAAWFALASPVFDAFAEQSARVDDLRRQLASYDGQIALRPAVEMRIAELNRQTSGNAGLIDGKSTELAAAAMQTLVRPVIESQAGQIRSAQNLPPVRIAGVERVDIQYDLSLPMMHLKDIAYRIEAGTPYLFLDGIDLRAPENWQTASASPDPPNLDVRWTVRGYRRAGDR